MRACPANLPPRPPCPRDRYWGPQRPMQDRGPALAARATPGCIPGWPRRPRR